MSNDFNEWMFKHKKMIKKLTNKNNQSSIQIKWKGAKVNNYYKNWQYSDTKEVIGVHELIQPYDWELDTEMNEDFELWKEELGENND